MAWVSARLDSLIVDLERSLRLDARLLVVKERDLEEDLLDLLVQRLEEADLALLDGRLGRVFIWMGLGLGQIASGVVCVHAHAHSHSHSCAHPSCACDARRDRRAEPCGGTCARR